VTPAEAAVRWLEHSPNDRSLADAFARELLDVQSKLEVTRQDNRRLVHEAERAREARDIAQAASAQRVWPVAVRCDGARCPSALAFDPMPDEDALATVVFALGWATTPKGHYCPRCR